MHDPRVGRFFAVDPLTAKYPWYTPYQFSGNQVTISRELEGLESDIDLNAQVTATFTLGEKSGTSHFNANFSIGISARDSFEQISLNIAGNLTNGGLGSANGQSGKLRGNLVISPSLTLGSGNTQTPAPLITFQSGSLTSVNNSFYLSATHAQNFVFSTSNSFQRVGAYGVKIGDFSLSTYNDTGKFLGDKEDRWWTGGGSVAITNFLGNSANTLIFGNDVFTGNSIPDMEKSHDADKSMPIYSYGKGNVLHYAGQSSADQSLNMAQSFLRLNTANRIFQISHSGSFDMFSQNVIHDAQNFHRFLSTTPNQLNFTVGITKN